METLIENKGEFSISTDTTKMDIALIHRYLSEESYWAKNIPFSTVAASINNSLNFGVFHGENQIGYGRIVSDFATVAYLCDVFILTEYRAKGLSKWLMEVINAHPNLQNLRRWILLTADAHELYRKFG